MTGLFDGASADDSQNKGYSASDIEVLEGLEPVRHRPGMYIGGTDERALHHLVVEILDNAMDEAVAGHASRIEMEFCEDGSVIISDNGRGIPVDPHPKYPQKSALEVILTTLHSGGKFSGKAYQTSGGLHGVGISVVNALADHMSVEVARDKQLYRQTFSRGVPTSGLEKLGAIHNRRGTTVQFHPDAEIFGEGARFKPAWLFQMARSKAYLYRGVEIRWRCAPALLKADSKVPTEKTIHYPNGLLDFLNAQLQGRQLLTENAFHGRADLPDGEGVVEYALSWPDGGEGFTHSYCNTIPTPQGGTHENGMRSAISRSLKQFGEMVGNKKAAAITADDVLGGAASLLSVFIRNPQFQGQTKERLANADVARLVDATVKDRFDHWLSSDTAQANELLDYAIDRAEERQRRKDARNQARKSATRKTRLPAKLADCARNKADDTELFIVEGDSAGGSAKQARRRETQAVLPLRGKILNVVSATDDKIANNTEVQSLIQSLGSGIGKQFSLDKLRYERVIIMTDADVDGAHIAALLVTFFYKFMKPLITEGHLYLAQPPLYRLSAGGKVEYARDDAHKDELMKTVYKGRSKIDISRFKGLGEMPAAQLRDTTMNPDTRTLIRVTLPDAAAVFALSESEDMIDAPPVASEAHAATDDLVERLMGRNAEPRFRFIQDNAAFVEELDV